MVSGILVIHNMSPNEIATFRLSTNLTPDLSTFDQILKTVRSRASENTTVALARTAYDLVSNFRAYNWTSAKPTEEVFDPVKLINTYGYGLCDAAARALATILHGLGIPARVWDLRVHVIAEFSDGKRWQALDPDMRVHAYARKTSQTLPARSYWKERNKLQPAEVPEPERAAQLRNQLVRALDKVTSPPRLAYWRPFAWHDAGIRLRPGETFVRYSDSRFGYFATISQEPPPLYANAIFRWARTLPADVPTEDDIDEATIRSRFPFVIVNGRITIKGIEPGVPLPKPWVVRPNGEYEPCELVHEVDDIFESQAVYELPESVRGQYELVLRIAKDVPFFDADLPHIQYEQVVVTQCSPTTFPALCGGNEQDYVHVEVSTEAPFDLSFLYRTPQDLPDDASLLAE
jgi:hypothetical protein